MIRGINRQIIEVSDPNGKYFEKAFLFVRPQTVESPPKALSVEADKILKAYNSNAHLYSHNTKPRKKKKFATILTAVFWSAIGAAIFELIKLIF